MAITEVRFANTTSYPYSIVNGGTVAVGDLLVCAMLQRYTNSHLIHTFTDNLNVGSWNAPTSLDFYTSQGANNPQLTLAWIKCDTAGTPTVSVGNTETSEGVVYLAQYTGFVNSASLVSADITQNQGTSTSPSATGLSNSKTNELTVVVACCGDQAGGQNFSSVTGSFTGRDGFGSGTSNFAYGDVIEATSGNSLSWGATITSAQWGVMLASWNDQATATNTAPIAWIT
jgi:hypothetical protein